MLLHLFLVATCLIHIDAVGATASSSIASSANVTNATTTTTSIGMNCSFVLNTTATMGFNESSVFHDADTPCFLANNETRSNLTTRGDSAEVPVQSTGNPSDSPTGSPTWAPSVSPTTEVPTIAPSTVAPTLQPTTPKPTPQPTNTPTVDWFGYWPSYSPSKTTDRTIHILPLGDSITSNGFGHLSYRYFLWKSFLTDPRVLESLGTQSIEYAGMLTNGYNGNPDWPPVAGQTFDQRHEGHWGWTTDAVVGELNAWLGASNAAFDCCSQKPYPDIALVHLGTNDCIYGEPVPQILEELNQVVEILHGHNSQMHVFLAKLIPADYAGIQGCLDELNGSLEDYFASPASGRVSVVDMATGFSVEADTWDSLHPNDQGSEKMANQWLNAILTEFEG